MFEIVKALSIQQPWVDAHLYLGKPVENRTWRPSHSLIGQRIALHASTKVDKDGMVFIRELPFVGPYVRRWEDKFTCSAILGTAVLAGYVIVRDGEWGGRKGTYVQKHFDVGDYDPLTDPWFFGPVGFVWRDVRELVTPIPCKGALGFWNIPHDIQAQLGTTETRPATVFALKVQDA